MNAPNAPAMAAKPNDPRPLVDLHRLLLASDRAEEAAALRARLDRRLRAADRHGRYRTYAPRIAPDEEDHLNVHSKIMIVDDELLWDGYVLGSASGLLMAIIASQIVEQTERGDELRHVVVGVECEIAVPA